MTVYREESRRVVRTLAVLPIKSFEDAKQRLSAALSSGSRQLLAQAMFADALAALRRVNGIERITVVTSDHEAEAILRGNRVSVLEDPHEDGQSAAALIGIDQALAERFHRVLLVPGDVPLLDPVAVDAMLERSRGERTAVTIVPDRHGTGTNALLVAPPDAIRPGFGAGSRERHEAATRGAGLSLRVDEIESLMYDVDTPEDLEALTKVLDSRHGVAPRTRGALRQLDRLRSSPQGSPARGDVAEREDGVRGSVRVMSGDPPREPAADQRQAADQRPAWA